MSATVNQPQNKMDWQNTVLATTVCGLLLVVVFLCPWRVESSGEIKWSPIYQQPMTYVRSYDADLGKQGSSRITTEEADIAYDILALEALALISAGAIIYFFSPNSVKECNQDL